MFFVFFLNLFYFPLGSFCVLPVCAGLSFLVLYLLPYIFYAFTYQKLLHHKFCRGGRSVIGQFRHGCDFMLDVIMPPKKELCLAMKTFSCVTFMVKILGQ